MAAAIGLAVSHAAQAERRDFEAAAAQAVVVHGGPLKQFADLWAGRLQIFYYLPFFRECWHQ